MCRNITTLRGLEPPASSEEIEAAARQYVRKVSGLAKVPAGAEEAFEAAVREVADSTTRLLAALPSRKQPPPTVPPLRRPEVQARCRVVRQSQPLPTLAGPEIHERVTVAVDALWAG